MEETKTVAKIKRQLFTYPRKTINLSELEQLFKPHCQTYEDFAGVVLDLEDEKVLEMVKVKGRTSRVPSLALQYRINKSLLVSTHHKELQRYRSILHPSIKN